MEAARRPVPSLRFVIFVEVTSVDKVTRLESVHLGKVIDGVSWRPPKTLLGYSMR